MIIEFVEFRRGVWVGDWRGKLFELQAVNTEASRRMNYEEGRFKVILAWNPVSSLCKKSLVCLLLWRAADQGAPGRAERA
jgi:hypothetical protein